jgi:hypothetical protein
LLPKVASKVQCRSAAHAKSRQAISMNQTRRLENMGGFGSGKPAERMCTDEMLALDISHFNRLGLLNHGQEFDCQWNVAGVVASIHIAVTRNCAVIGRADLPATSQQPRLRYLVPVEWNACRFGGQRPWWRCPASACGRRVGVLYLGGAPACRHCYSLTYRSRREATDCRAARRADTIRQRLCWQPGIANGLGSRPKGMHASTFGALLDQHEQCVGKALVHGAVRYLEQI